MSISSRSLTLSAAAVASAAALVTLSAAPGVAATTAHAEASAIIVTVGGQPASTGNYTATNTGDGETTTGTNQPAVPALLTQQGALRAGTLFQDATARDNGDSAACAGLAGDGATLVQVGRGETCFRGGDNARLTLTELDPSALTAQLPPELRDQLGPLAGPLQEQLDQVIAQLPAGGIFLDLTGIEGHCSAMPTAGDSVFADVALRGAIGEDETTILDFQNRYDPNTTLPTDLAAFYDQLMADIEDALRTGLDGQTGPLAELPAGLRDAALEDALDQIATQLQPLEDQVLRLTLNKQERGADKITVTALDLDLLPAANQQVGGQAFSLELGQAICQATRVATPPAPPAPQPQVHPALPAYPTHVPAGQVGDAGPEHDTLISLLALGGLVAVATGTAVASRRRG